MVPHTATFVRVLYRGLPCARQCQRAARIVQASSPLEIPARLMVGVALLAQLFSVFQTPSPQFQHLPCTSGSESQRAAALKWTVQSPPWSAPEVDGAVSTMERSIVNKESKKESKKGSSYCIADEPNLGDAASSSSAASSPSAPSAGGSPSATGGFLMLTTTPTTSICSPAPPLGREYQQQGLQHGHALSQLL